jgi:hypothetical protein
MIPYDSLPSRDDNLLLNTFIIFTEKIEPKFIYWISSKKIRILLEMTNKRHY